MYDLSVCCWVRVIHAVSPKCKNFQQRITQIYYHSDRLFQIVFLILSIVDVYNYVHISHNMQRVPKAYIKKKKTYLNKI